MNNPQIVRHSSDITKSVTASLFGWLILVALSANVDAQHEPDDVSPPSHDVILKFDSGFVQNDSDDVQMVWSHEAVINDAEWTRLYFDHVDLSATVEHSSIIRITSLEDGAFQLLNRQTAAQWQNSSAYFNGNRLLVELLAHPHSKNNRISIAYANAGEIPDLAANESICGSSDDRELSDDPRMGRLSNGCTAWMFNNRTNCLLTAGHCLGPASVIYFNVPISDPNGSPNFPPPEDQYAIDQSSKQLMTGGSGFDWGYFGCFDNSNTGLSPYLAQGNVSFQLVQPEAMNLGDEIRITGYGTTNAPVDPTFNGAQKTHVGPYTSLEGTVLRYHTDTSGGNSGSPVVLEQTGQAIGIHGQAGCTSNPSSSNRGTGANNSDFLNALANPLGICATTQFVLGDVNCDGEINLLDVAPFVELLSTGGFSVKADINGDGNVDLLDVSGFVNLLNGN